MSSAFKVVTLTAWTANTHHRGEVPSVNRLGDLHFGQLFKACGNSYYAQIAHILGNFCKRV